MTKYLVEYIRAWPCDESTYSFVSKGQPIGCIVALSPEKIGYSICCPKDNFCKQRGKSIAVGRAEKGYMSKVPNRIVDVKINDDYSFYHLTLRELLDQKIEEMRERAKRYFK